MLPGKVISALERLLVIVYRSLPMYLTDAVPYAGQQDQRAVEVLKFIVADQKSLAARIAHFLQSHHVPLNMGHYPMSFTGMHDCSIAFFISQLIDCQRQDIAKIEKIVAEASADARGQALAEEALGAAKAHLEALEELATRVTSPSGASAAG
jgi:hypothetical protein